MPFKRTIGLSPAEGTIPVKDLKQSQQEARKARRRAEAIALRLDQAREAHGRLHGECVADDQQDIMAIGARLMQSQEAVAMLETTLVIAQRQEAEADATLATAAVDAKRDGLRVKLTQLAAVGVKVDAAMRHLTQVVDELVPLLDETRALGFDVLNVQLSSAAILFKIRLLESCQKMPSCRQGESWFLKPEPWSASLPTVEQADHTR